MSVDDQANNMMGLHWSPLVIFEKLDGELEPGAHAENLFRSYHHQFPFVFTFPPGGLETWAEQPQEHRFRVLSRWAPSVAEGIMKNRGKSVSITYGHKVIASGAGNIVQIDSPNATASVTLSPAATADQVGEQLAKLGVTLTEVMDLVRAAKEDAKTNKGFGAKALGWAKKCAAKLGGKISEVALVEFLKSSWPAIMQLVGGS